MLAWVKGIVLFLLGTSILENLITGEAYKKYLRTAVGLIFIVIVLEPVNRFLKNPESFKLLWQEAQEKIQVRQDNALESLFEGEAASKVMNTYQEALSLEVQAMLENMGVMADVVVLTVTDQGEDYGKIEKIKINVKKTSVSWEETKKDVLKMVMEKYQLSDQRDIELTLKGGRGLD